MMMNHDHNHNPKFPSTLRKIYDKCQKAARLATPTHPLLLEQDSTNFLCVWTGLQPTLDPRAFRHTLGQLLLGRDSFRLVEVVGDSSHGFTLLGRQTAKDTIVPLLTDHDGPVVLEYGYTASSHDANWVVNDILAAVPELRSRTVANVVFKSATAVEHWECEATGNVGGMVLVYDGDGETGFGSDIWVSDDIMSVSHGDVLVCLEGGPQAFAQAVGVCLKGVSVVVLTGPGMRDGSAATADFSAGCLLKILRDQFELCSDRKSVTIADKERLQRAATVYLDGIDALRGEGGRKKYEAIQTSVRALLTGPENLQGVRVTYVI